ncbi:Methylthioribose-1-phosphate isomerase, partial [Trinorchestia longiramus]
MLEIVNGCSRDSKFLLKKMAPLEAIIWCDTHLKIIDQLLLPTQTTYVDIKSVQQGWDAINKMQVRGAPAIAIVGCLSLASHLIQPESTFTDCAALDTFVSESLAHLVTARPTAVNMKAEAGRLTQHSSKLAESCQSVADMKNSLVEWCKNLLKEDVATNKSLGDWGMKAILERAQTAGRDQVTLLTICNTGSLATAGYGTALGVVRSLHTCNKLGGVYMLETRPYLQGARLSALEAVVEDWPNGTLVCDGAAGALLSTHTVDGAVVGADRVAANGDTANKIGTYQ